MPDRGEYVQTGFHKLGDVIRVVLPAIIRITTGWPSAEELSIDVEKVIVVRGDKHFRQFWLLRDREGLSEIGEVIQVCRPIPDVSRRPIALSKAGIKTIRRAVGADPARLIPYTHFPPETRSRGQWSACISNPGGFIRIDFSAVPPFSLVRSETFRA